MTDGEAKASPSSVGMEKTWNHKYGIIRVFWTQEHIEAIAKKMGITLDSYHLEQFMGMIEDEMIDTLVDAGDKIIRENLENYGEAKE